MPPPGQDRVSSDCLSYKGCHSILPRVQWEPEFSRLGNEVGNASHQAQIKEGLRGSLQVVCGPRYWCPRVLFPHPQTADRALSLQRLH